MILGPWLATGAATCLALVIAVALGFALGGAEGAQRGGRTLTNLLTEARAAVLPFVLVPILWEAVGGPLWLSVGLSVGLAQATAVARWLLRAQSDWSSSLSNKGAGPLRATLVEREVFARGAVTGILSLTALQIVLVEAVWGKRLVTAGAPAANLGELLTQGGAVTIFTGAAVLTAVLLGTELLFARLLARSGWTKRDHWVPSWRKKSRSPRP